MSAANGATLDRLVGSLIAELEAESERWQEERRKVEMADEPNIGTAICNAKFNAYADAAFRVRRAFDMTPPDACGFRTANAQISGGTPSAESDCSTEYPHYHADCPKCGKRTVWRDPREYGDTIGCMRCGHEIELSNPTGLWTTHKTEERT